MRKKIALMSRFFSSGVCVYANSFIADENSPARILIANLRAERFDFNVSFMDILSTLALSILGSMIANLICDWLKEQP